jgi:TolA-binding protein
MKRLLASLAISSLVIPATGSAASREQQEMQRDIAQLQDQVRMLQSTVDQKLSTVQTLVEQALDASNKANTNVSVLNSGITQTIDREFKGALTPVAGLSAKLENTTNDLAEVKNAVADLQTQMNREHQLLVDISNTLKVMQAPQAAPPPPGGTASASGTPPPAAALWETARTDFASGKADLAADDFTQFLRYYPDDPNAAQAQFQIGQIHTSQGKYDQAVMDFDAVLERYPDNKYTPEAYFFKGMALRQSGHRDAAATEFRALIKKFPKSDRADDAADQLRALGLSTTSASTVKHKK